MQVSVVVMSSTDTGDGKFPCTRIIYNFRSLMTCVFDRLPGSPLTDSYFDRLSMSLGDEWMLVADRLRISRPSLQRIACSFAHLPDANEAINKSIKHMLIQWFKSSAKAKNKVGLTHPNCIYLFTRNEMLIM